jgi:hypothetical protein
VSSLRSLGDWFVLHSNTGGGEKLIHHRQDELGQRLLTSFMKFFLGWGLSSGSFSFFKSFQMTQVLLIEMLKSQENRAWVHL